MKQIRLKLATKPNEVDYNNRIYTSENLDKLKNSDNVKKMIENKQLYLTLGNEMQDIIEKHTSVSVIDPEYIIGTVIEWNDDDILVLVEDKIIQKYKIGINEYYAGMFTIAKTINPNYKWYDKNGILNHANLVEHEKLICFNILDKHYSFDIPSFTNQYLTNRPLLLVSYHRDNCPDLLDIEINDKGDFVDLRAAEHVVLKKGEFKVIDLGVSIKLPSGYWGQFVPRSSTYKNFGIMQTNSFAVIDESYCGNDDVWKMPVIALRDTEININDRICQFRIVKKEPFDLITVDRLDGNNRGGFGSTGIN